MSESGIADHRDVLRLRHRVNGFLVGSSLVSQPDVARAARHLAYGRVKVCGLTRPQDAKLCWLKGATWGGVIFAPKSPRQVTAARALEIRRASPLKLAGVFVDAQPAHVAELAAALSLNAVQLHGDETKDYIDNLRQHLPDNCAVWKAFQVRDHIPLPSAFHADKLLLDTYRKGLQGGTGEVFDWRAIHHHPERHRLIVAGGLSPHNATDADALDVHLLDVNSGVESAPGVKDPKLLAAFFEALRSGERSSNS